MRPRPAARSRTQDFDVSTNALPAQVHALFRRSRIVGRRFQIVHVRSGRDVIEVSTFRGHHSPDFDEDGTTSTPMGSAVRANRACCCATTFSAPWKKMHCAAISA
ncbi:MAG: hypothetical protein IPJ33_19520 [Gammaproteobacteria bacterium]|nr:hypothetical protein [Gammaproteobacteria bacterium]